MSALASELGHLALAERHIVAGELRLCALRAGIEEQRRLGHDVSLSEQVLQTMSDGLEAFRRHRELIVRRVDDLRSGSAGSAG